MTPVEKGTTLLQTNKEGSLRIQANLVWKLENSDCIEECNAVIQEQLEAGII